MNCGDAERLLGAFDDGELNAQQRREVEAHLSQCPDCSALLRELKEQSAALGALRGSEPQPPAGMKLDLWRRLRRQAAFTLARILIVALSVVLAVAFFPIAAAEGLPMLSRVLFVLSGLAVFAAVVPLLWRALWDVKNVVWVRFAAEEEEEEQ